ncbi:hypothetical protein ACIQNG_25035 [Streptomyces sp. NPDC091377]|uniref:hypothetical protein n=1 Tax=unclassified Streptomyces TaxID=2593676 RepID=UPI0037FACB6B
MTTDGVGGALGAGLMFGPFGVLGKAIGDIVTEYTSFTEFKRRVDDLIRDLKESPAGEGKVGEEPLTRVQFGGGDGQWSEAAGLFGSYETVITELENLSKLLSDSIEGMGIAVLASHKGYENLDLDIRDRMAAISVDTTEHYGGAYDPERSKPEKPDDTGADGPDGTGTGGGDDAGGTI